MGLDSVELVIATEEAFGVEITDAEAEKTVTPRMLAELVASKLSMQGEDKCLSQQAFYRLRKAFHKLFDTSKKAVKPDSLLQDIIPSDNMTENWQNLKAEVGTEQWLELVRPTWMIKAFSALGISTVILSSLALMNLYPSLVWLAGLISIAPAVWVIYLCVRLTRKQKKSIDPHHPKVKDLVRYLVACNPSIFKTGKEWSPEQVKAVIREVIIEQIGISDFKDDDHFINDMGID